MNWFTDCLTKKYADFSGRAHREEFWMYILFNFIISAVLGAVDSYALGMPGTLQGIYGLGTLCPTLAVSARRLHDIGKPGIYLLLHFICCLGSLVLIYFFIQESQPGSNEYGAQPT